MGSPLALLVLTLLLLPFQSRATEPSLAYHRLRGGLANARRALGSGAGRVVFLGGSITANPGWRDLVGEELRRRFPDARLELVNAGEPSMGSVPNAFRMERDVLAGGPVDLLFVEAAVNDATNGRSPTSQLRGMEGIVRGVLLARPRTDVVLLYFVDPDKMRTYRAGRTPDVIRVHERVATHYDVPSIDLAREVTERIDAGEFTWEDDFRDLHPSPFGQRLYFEAVRRLLDAAWAGDDEAGPAPAERVLPAPLDPSSYAHGRLGPLDAAELGPGWRLEPSWRPARGGTRRGFVDVPMLVSERPGGVLAYPFEGAAIGVFVAAGHDAGILEWRLDGGPWSRVDLFTRWSAGLHLPWAHVLADGLDPKTQRLELRVGEPVDGSPRPGGAAVRIAWFLVDAPD